MQRATEMETLAGPQVEKVKPKKQTAQEIMNKAEKKNPHRFYSITPFKQLMGMTTKKNSKSRSPDRRGKANKDI